MQQQADVERKVAGCGPSSPQPMPTRRLSAITSAPSSQQEAGDAQFDAAAREPRAVRSPAALAVDVRCSAERRASLRSIGWP